MTFVDILAMHADFCMKFFIQLLNNKMYTLSPSFDEYIWKWQIMLF